MINIYSEKALSVIYFLMTKIIKPLRHWTSIGREIPTLIGSLLYFKPLLPTTASTQT